MSTEKTRKNPDYTESAVNLGEPAEEILLSLDTLGKLESFLLNAQNQAENCIPIELKDKIALLKSEIDDRKEVIRQWIDEFGSYQDVETGEYAVKQKKQSWEYSPVPFLQASPDSLFGKCRDMVLETIVNEQALKGLIKGKILNEQNLRDEGVIIPGKVTYNYIIKAGDHADGA